SQKSARCPAEQTSHECRSARYGQSSLWIAGHCIAVGIRKGFEQFIDIVLAPLFNCTEDVAWICVAAVHYHVQEHHRFAQLQSYRIEEVPVQLVYSIVNL